MSYAWNVNVDAMKTRYMALLEDVQPIFELRQKYIDFTEILGDLLEKVPNIFSRMVVFHGDLPWYNPVQNSPKKQIRE